MNAFANAVQSGAPARTENGALSNSSTGSDLVNLFASIGSARQRDVTQDFINAFLQNKEWAMRMLFWSRDIRGGAGERETFRKITLKLEEVAPEVLDQVLRLVPEYGRWDDLLVFKTPYIKAIAYEVIREAILAGNGLCAKWMPRKGPIAAELRTFLGFSPKQYRKTLVGLTKVVETLMCQKEWKTINFSHVPSVASARLQKAFGRNAPEQYGAYLASLEKGEKGVKINATTVFPHDIIRSFATGNERAAEQQWKALPNYAGAKNVLPMVDLSGSMSAQISGSVTAMDIAIGLGLYMSEKQNSAFKDIILTFSSQPKLFKLTANSTYGKVKEIMKVAEVSNTNIQAGFDRILDFARMNKVSQDDMPEYLLIVSDMEFDSCANQKTNYQDAKDKFAAAGYTLPKIIFWCVTSRNKQFPVTTKDENTALISGYSPAIMKALVSGKLNNFSPEGVMLETIMNERYDAVSKALSY